MELRTMKGLDTRRLDQNIEVSTNDFEDDIDEAIRLLIEEVSEYYGADADIVTKSAEDIKTEKERLRDMHYQELEKYQVANEARNMAMALAAKRYKVTYKKLSAVFNRPDSQVARAFRTVSTEEYRGKL